jgi:hypothetical protein
MYEAEIEVHNLRNIETEPEKLCSLKSESLSELMEKVTFAVASQKPLIQNGYSLTVHISFKE